MKNLANLVCTLMLIVVGLGAQAMNIAPLPIKEVRIVAAKETNKVNVFFNQFQADEVTIKLRDESGYVLFTERVKGTTKYAKTYDLSNLPAGEYQLILSDEIKEYVQTISIDKTGWIVVQKNAANVIYNPAIIQSGKVLDLNLLMGVEEDVKVSFLDENGDAVYSDTIKDAFKIEKRYQLSELAPGKYTLKLTTKYKTFYKNFEL